MKLQYEAKRQGSPTQLLIRFFFPNAILFTTPTLTLSTVISTNITNTNIYTYNVLTNYTTYTYTTYPCTTLQQLLKFT